MSIRYDHYDSEEGYGEGTEAPAHDREISLGTTTVLGIFLALALVCALCFGFGYSMGRRSVPSALANVSTGISAPLPENKPTPGSLTPARSSYAPPIESSGNAAASADTASGARPADRQKIKPAAATAADESGNATGSRSDLKQRQLPRPPEQASEQPVEPSRTSAAAPGTSFVQVAAISAAHKEDATMLKGSLERRGYSVTVRQGTSDELLHVQIGPMATKKDAEAMKQRLLADGYNAIVK